ncbi:MAG TPA: NAD(P)-dependent oxidoreductase [Candidatus Paceibacterota bacterium]
MKYLVLGSSGQIGAELCEYLKKHGHEYVEFDLVRGPDEDLRTNDNPLLDAAVKECDFVFFLAFDIGGAKYLKKYQDTYDYMTNNQKIMVNTFGVLKKYNKPFLFASSQMSSMSFSTYGLLKNLGEKMTRSIGGRVVQFWNVYGLERDLEKSHVITDLILKADQTGKIELMTNGEESRQFLHAEDCSRCLVTLSERYADINPDQPLHVSSFEWSKVIDIAGMISSNFENIPVLPSEAHDEVQHSMKIEPSQYIFQFWKPEIKLEDGIRDIIKQMRELKMIK